MIDTPMLSLLTFLYSISSMTIYIWVNYNAPTGPRHRWWEFDWGRGSHPQMAKPIPNLVWNISVRWYHGISATLCKYVYIYTYTYIYSESKWEIHAIWWDISSYINICMGMYGIYHGLSWYIFMDYWWNTLLYTNIAMENHNFLAG